MVKTNNVVKFQSPAYTVNPESVILLFYFVYIVNGVAPKLPVSRKIIGRNARFKLWRAVFIQLEKRLVRPHFAAVERGVNWQIAYDFYAF